MRKVQYCDFRLLQFLTSFLTLAGVNLVHDPQSNDVMKACSTRRHMRAGSIFTDSLPE